MFRERTFYLLLATFFLGALLVGYSRQNVTWTELELAPESRPARGAPEKRIWRPTKLDHPAVLDGDGALAKLELGKRGPSGGLFVLDYDDLAVEKVSAHGDVTQTYRGMPEDGAPSDFAVDSTGAVWIAYRDSGILRVLAEDGTPLAPRYLPISPHRVALAEDGRFVVMSARQSELFHIYAADGTPLATTGRILANDIQNGLLLDGAIATDGRNGFVYSPTYLGLLAAYTFDGERRFVVETVGGLGKIPRLARSGETRRVEPGAPIRSLSVHVDQSRIYVLAEREAGHSSRRILDVYSNTDGTYLESIRLSSSPRDIIVDRGLLYTVHTNKLARWGDLGHVERAATGGKPLLRLR